MLDTMYVCWVERLRNEVVLRRIGDVRNEPKKKDELAWTLHEKKLSDDKCNGKRGRNGRKGSSR